MKKSTIAGTAVAAVLLLLALAAGYRALYQSASPEAASLAEAGDDQAHASFLYGRIATVDGATYEGRLRFGGGQEAFWSDYFNGSKKQNPWTAFVSPGLLPKERDPLQIFGFEILDRQRPMDLNRLFMARFGDLARIEARGRDVRVTLKSGTAHDLDRFSASDFDDGVRVWDERRGTADLDSLRIRTIDLLPCPRSGPAPDRLYGTVRTSLGTFTGFVQWDRELSLGSDMLRGRTSQGEQELQFSKIRSIARHSSDSALVTLLDGRQIRLSGTRNAGQDNRGVYVDDPRYGRVLVSWNAFDGIDFSSGPSGPAYGDFPPGGPIMGAVTTRGGRRLAGRLVFDLDESEITETLDAPAKGVDYTIPFGLVAALELPTPGAQRARITLHSGEQIELDRAGDLSGKNAGILIFVGAQERPEYVPWTDVLLIRFDRPPAMYPSPAGR